MRRLKFETFLERYIHDVTGKRTLNIHKLSKIARKNVRLVDPLILYCTFTSKRLLLLGHIESKYAPLVAEVTRENFLDDAFDNNSFKKIWNSYQRQLNMKENNNEIKKLARNKIVKMMKKKKITNYRVYSNLKLNPGNVNDFLTNSNVEKVSLDLVKRINDFVENY